MTPRSLPLVASLLAFGALAACSSGGDAGVADQATGAAPIVQTPAPSTSAAAGAGTSTDPAAAPDVPAALQFSAPLIGGGNIELTTLAGRPVLLWFWAPW